MSQRTHPTLVGAFILAGLIIGTAGVLVLTGSRWLGSSTPAILYFDASLKGLSPGAPVKFRGVTIGEVRRTMIHFNQATNDVHMPVLIEIHSGLVRQSMDTDLSFSSPGRVKMLTDRGLRGRLEAESLVTGVLYVELDILDPAPPPQFHQQEARYIEIPTAPTRIQQLLSNLASIDLPRLVNRVETVLDHLDGQLSSLQTGEISNSLTNLLASIQNLVTAPNLTNAVAALNQSLGEIRQLAANLNQEVKPLASSAAEALASAQAAMDQVQQSAEALDDLLSVDGRFQAELMNALNSLNHAARSITALSDQLTRHPNAVLVGRRERRVEP
jgi:paraquat-inducible protein B